MASDNTTAVFYLNKQGLLYLTVQLWEWCYSHHIYPVVVHVASEDNVLADRLSRLQVCSHEWALDKEVFLSLCQRRGMPRLDVFASSSNAKCVCYCSRTGVSCHSLVPDLMGRGSSVHVPIHNTSTEGHHQDTPTRSECHPHRP